MDISYRSIVGMRRSNEDRIDIRKKKNTVFLGIYDGHGGCNTSSMLHDSLYMSFLRYGTNDICKSFASCYREMDKLSLSKRHYKCGSTALNCYIEDNKICIANVGDSRAILCNNTCIELSTTHNIDNEKEKSRIEELGGVFDDRYVQGVLNMTRAIGDHDVKKYVISTPDIRVLHDVHGTLIMGSDGLYDTLSDDEICALISNVDSKYISSVLSQKAYEKGSTDNISVVVAKV